MKIKDIILIGTALTLTFVCHSESYGQIMDKNILKFTYDLLKVNYPDNDALCVSDSIYSLDWFIIRKANKKINSLITKYIEEDKFKKHTPEYSQKLNDLFHQELDKGLNYKYSLRFSDAVYRDSTRHEMMFRCDVVPNDFDAGDTTSYLVYYNQSGINMLTKIEAQTSEQ